MIASAQMPHATFRDSRGKDSESRVHIDRQLLREQAAEVLVEYVPAIAKFVEVAVAEGVAGTQNLRTTLLIKSPMLKVQEVKPRLSGYRIICPRDSGGILGETEAATG